LKGSSTLGANVQVGYFAQAHESLDPRLSIIDEITRTKPMTQSDARNYLGQFLFSGDDVFRTIDTLSGGERGRVALAKLSLQGANLLLLDEPTNHLDIDSQEILQDVLETFAGTVLLISHDRYLIQQLATQIWAVSPQASGAAHGTYDEYLTARNNRLLADQAAAPEQKPRRQAAQYAEKKQGLNPYQLKKKLEELEAHIAQLEQQHAELQRALEAASTAGDGERVRLLGEQYTQTEQRLEAAIEEWGLLAE
jgi:ATP-binding cassette subfamily F protein 3